MARRTVTYGTVTGGSSRRFRNLALAVIANLALMAWCEPASSQEAPSYVGAATCGWCHPAQLIAQSASAHAHALSPATQHRLADSFAPTEELIRPPRYHFQFRRNEERLQVRVSDAKDAIELPVEWAFGAGEQAVTFVSRWNEDWYLEHYFSYYPATGSLGPTPGHVGRPSHTIPLAMGLMYRTLDPAAGIIQCFQCHSTAPPIVGPENTIRPAELGVRCESCHGPGQAHVQAASQGEAPKARALIQNPKRLSATELNQFCGRCHRPPVGGPVVDLSKAWNVRYQPVYLAKSACFRQSKGALSCLTCHDPHGDLGRESAHYDAQCAQCHSAKPHPKVAGYAANQAGGCVGCHMPRVATQENLEFTNHWIGIYGENKLQPRVAEAR
jgi:Cytochrome c554 and c-prime